VTRLALHTAVVIATLLVLAVLWELRAVVLLFVLSLVAAATVRPWIDWLSRTGLPRPLGLTGMYVVLLGLLGLMLTVVGSLLLGDVQKAGDDFVHLIEHVHSVWTYGAWPQRMIARATPPPEEWVAVLAGPEGAAVMQTLLGTAFGIMESAINLIVILVLSIYWTIDRIYFERLWLSLLPVRQRTAGRDIWRAIESEVGAYFHSELVQSLLAGLVLWLAYRLLGLPYPTLLAVVAALAWLIPWIGVVAAIMAVGLLSLPLLIPAGASGSVSAVVVAALFTPMVLLIMDIVVEPRLFHRRRYNSLLVALAVVALATTFGILGLVLGPALAIAVQILIEHLLRLRMAARAEATPPSLSEVDERLARLRAQVQTLDSPPPELTTMVQRLTELIEDVREVAPEPEPQARQPDRPHAPVAP